jgi:sporulation protein YlmC with PRC-barrel domain
MATKTRGDVASNETSTLISASKVQGTPVYNPKGEKLGRVEEVMIDKLSGVVAYAVLSFGGIMGIGDRHYPLPWQVLDYEPQQGGYVVDLDKDMLEDAPSYRANEEGDWADREWGKKVHDYYEVPPYWI